MVTSVDVAEVGFSAADNGCVVFDVNDPLMQNNKSEQTWNPGNLDTGQFQSQCKTTRHSLNPCFCSSMFGVIQ